jgi:hypothetical protein
VNADDSKTDLLERIADLEDEVLERIVERDDLKILLEREKAFSRSWKGLYELESRLGHELANRVQSSLDELEMQTNG